MSMYETIEMSCDIEKSSCDSNVTCTYTQGQATDIAIQAEEIVKLKKLLNELLSQHTGQPVDLIGKLSPKVA